MALAPRLHIYPEFAADPGTWLDPGIRFPVLDRSDAEALARETAGRSATPRRRAATPADTSARAPDPAGPARPVGRGAGRRRGSASSPGVDELVTLFGGPGAGGGRGGARSPTTCAARPSVTSSPSSATATSTTPTLHLQVPVLCLLQGPAARSTCGATPYLLDFDEIARRVVEADGRRRHRGLPPGRHPPQLRRRLLPRRRPGGAGRFPAIHIHGFTALEVPEGARRLGEPLARLPAPAQGGRPGQPCPARRPRSSTTRSGRSSAPTRSPPRSGSRSTGWPTRVGLRSNITIMFGQSSARHWARHCVRTRDLQAETGGFTEFVPSPSCTWPARSTAAQVPAGPTFRETVLIHAVGRIAYPGIPNIQVSWVKMGADGVRQALLSRGNDVGGTLMDENICRAAGAATVSAWTRPRSGAWSSRSAAAWSSAPPSTAAPAPNRRQRRFPAEQPLPSGGATAQAIPPSRAPIPRMTR